MTKKMQQSKEHAKLAKLGVKKLQQMAKEAGYPTTSRNVDYLVGLVLKAKKTEVKGSGSNGDLTPSDIKKLVEEPSVITTAFADPSTGAERAAHDTPPAAQAGPGKAIGGPREPKDQVTVTGSPQGKKLSKLDISELQHRYLEVVGRPTSSNNSAYMIWKIRQAEQGKVPVGPRQSRKHEGAYKVLPVRMDAGVVTKLDEARQRLGFKSRQALFDEAVKCLMAERGEPEVAALIEAQA